MSSQPLAQRSSVGPAGTAACEAVPVTMRRLRVIGPVCAVVGVLFGALVSFANGGSGAVLESVSLVLGVGWSWAALAFGAGALTARRGYGAVAGVVALVSAVGCYYATDLARGVYRYVDESDPTLTRTWTDWAGLRADLTYWWVVALVAGCLLGMLGTGARRRGFVGLLCRLVVPIIAIVDTLSLLRLEVRLGQYDAARPVAIATYSAVGIVAVVAALLLISVYVSQRRAEHSPERMYQERVTWRS